MTRFGCVLAFARLSSFLHVKHMFWVSLTDSLSQEKLLTFADSADSGVGGVLLLPPPTGPPWRGFLFKPNKNPPHPFPIGPVSTFG